MSRFTRSVAGLRALFRRHGEDMELDAELHTFLDAAIEDRVRAGMSREEAARAARVSVGSLAAVRDYTRDAGWEVAIETAARDVRYAVRVLRRAPAYAAVAILTLALGIGASTAIFSVVDGVVLRALPFDEHDRLVAVGTAGPSPFAVPLVTVPVRPQALSVIASQDFLDWRERQEVFSGLAAFSVANLTLREPGGEPEEVRALRVTAGFFDILRVRLAAGRTFSQDEERPGGARVAVISHGLWQRRFGGVSNIVGRTIQLEYNGYEIVGVAPPGFTYPIGSDKPTEMWLPLVMGPQDRIRAAGTYSASLRAIGRLADGISIEQARARMDQIARTLEAEHPEWNRNRRIAMLPLHESIVGTDTRSWMMLLLGSVIIVLLIACANVGGLMLARASVRAREIGIRAATGATRGRLVRQLLVELLVLWSTATVVGVLFARWGVQVLKAAMPDSVPRVASIAIDLRVLAVAAAAGITTALLFGLLPVLRSTRPDLTLVLDGGSRVRSAGLRQRLRSGLVVAEIALAAILLVGAGLFVRSFERLMAVDLGFDPENVLAASVSLFRAEPGTPPPGWTALEDIVADLRGVAGVEEAAAISGTIPLANSTSMTRLNIPGQPFSLDDTGNQLFVSSVTAAYHRVMRIPLRAGRYIEDVDRAGATPVMVINEAAVRRFFPNESPIGRTLTVDVPRLVVGVVGDVRQAGFETDVAPTAYLPLLQTPVPRSARSAQVLLRTTGDPMTVLPAVRVAVSRVLRGEPVRDARTIEEVLTRLTAERRVSALLLGLFGVVGLLVAAVGVYGIMAYIVGGRTQEIAVRMAVGATRARVAGEFLRQAAAVTATGVAVGVVAAWMLGSTVKAFLFQIEPTDVAAFAAAMVVLFACAIMASAFPVFRAARVDPAVALRTE